MRELVFGFLAVAAFLFGMSAAFFLSSPDAWPGIVCLAGGAIGAGLAVGIARIDREG